jgi:hypothetical protein
VLFSSRTVAFFYPAWIYVHSTVHVLDKQLANLGILMDMGISIKKTNRESTYKVLEALVCPSVAISLLHDSRRGVFS